MTETVQSGEGAPSIPAQRMLQWLSEQTLQWFHVSGQDIHRASSLQIRGLVETRTVTHGPNSWMEVRISDAGRAWLKDRNMDRKQRGAR